MSENGTKNVGFGPSEQVIAAVRQETDTVFLAFSTGKDSIAAYLAIKGRFRRIIPFYRYLIPGLEFIERSLEYFERELFGGERIIRVPNPALPRMLNAFVFQPPERCAIIEAAELPEVDYADLNEWIAQDMGLDPAKVFVASGVRAADSPMRRRTFSMHGAINWTERMFYPVWDWNKERLLTAIAQSGIKLPVDYQLFGRTFDGIDLRFLWPIRERFPRDYQRILDWFPLAELEIKRYEFAQAARAAQAGRTAQSAQAAQRR